MKDLPFGCVVLGDMTPLWGGDMWAVGLVCDSGPRGEAGGDILEFVLALREAPEVHLKIMSCFLFNTYLLFVFLIGLFYVKD